MATPTDASGQKTVEEMYSADYTTLLVFIAQMSKVCFDCFKYVFNLYCLSLFLFQTRPNEKT